MSFCVTTVLGHSRVLCKQATLMPCRSQGADAEAELARMMVDRADPTNTYVYVGNLSPQARFTLVGCLCCSVGGLCGWLELSMRSEFGSICQIKGAPACNTCSGASPPSQLV